MRFEASVQRLTAIGSGPTTLPLGPQGLTVTFLDERLRPRLDPSETARAAAVLVLVFPDRDGEARIVLTERLSYDGHHSGEVSLPGGKAEPGDADSVATALREANEEVGLDPVAAGVRVLGRLDEVFIPLSDFRITPIVAVAERTPVLAANPAEVARILTAPVTAVPAGRGPRDRRADRQRLAAPLQRLPHRRLPCLGRDRPDPRPARGRSRGRSAIPEARPRRRLRNLHSPAA